MKKRRNLLTSRDCLAAIVAAWAFLAFIFWPPAVQAASSPPNLILNPSVEISQAGTNNPQFWNVNHSNKNSARFFYPVSGSVGQKAVKVQVTKYASGEESWYPKRLKISPNVKYVYSDTYKSTAKSYIHVRITLTDNRTVDLAMQTVPASDKWKTAQLAFTAPAKAASVVIYHALKSTGSLTTDNFSLTASRPDISIKKIPAKLSVTSASVANPLISFSGPIISYRELAGEIPVEAVPAPSVDQKKIKSVRFLLDGQDLNAEISAPPYIWYWKTKNVANGSHQVVARMSDVNGHIDEVVAEAKVNNPAEISPIMTPLSVIFSSVDSDGSSNGSTAVSNPVDPHDTTSSSTEDTTSTSTDDTATTSNLILNPHLEKSHATGTPANWQSAIWGNNAAIFTYPAEGIASSRGINITINQFTDGDAKWYFDNVAVAPGNIYVYSDMSKSSTTTDVVARFLMANGTYTYYDIGTVASSSSWQKFSNTITVPSGVVALTVFHLLGGAGTLTLDDFSLEYISHTAIQRAFEQGYVSLTFDDGWASQYNEARPLMNQAGLKGTYYIITNEIANAAPYNLIVNPDLIASSGPSGPDFWTATSYGKNDAAFTYPITGASSTQSGAKVAITNYEDGDAKWYPDEVSVVPGQSYRFSDKYLSTASTSTVEARFTLSNPAATSTTYQYITLGHLASSTSWQTFSGTVVAPPQAVSMIIYHSLESAGELSIDQFDLEVVHDYMNAPELLSLQSEGNEIGAHTMTHPAMSTLTADQMKAEVEGAKTALLDYGLTPVNSFAYPEGFYNDTLINIVKAAGYQSARTVDWGYNTIDTDPYKLETQGLASSTTFAQVKSWIDAAVSEKTWQPLVFHQIDHSGLDYSTTPELFKQIVDYIKQTNVPVITISEGINLMK